MNTEIEKTEQTPEVNSSQVMDEIISEKFGDQSNSDEAINFMQTPEFEKLYDEKQSSIVKQDEKIIDDEKVENEIFDLKQLDSDEFDLSNLKPSELTKAINVQQKTFLEETKKIKDELEVAKTNFKDTKQENGELQEILSNIPGFLESLGVEFEKDKNFQDQIKDFMLTTAAEKSGLSVKDYLKKAEAEKAALDEAATNVEKAVDSSLNEFKEDEMFSKLDVKDKEEKLKKHLIDKKFDPTKGDIKKEARILFMDEYDELLKQESINQALSNNANGSKGEPNVKGKNKKLEYDPTKDAQFMKELKEELW